MIALLMIVINLAVAVISAMAVYSFTGSFIWAGISFFVLGGGSTNIIFAFIALPMVEYFLGDGITWHSFAVWGLNILILSTGAILSTRANKTIY